MFLKGSQTKPSHSYTKQSFNILVMNTFTEAETLERALATRLFKQAGITEFYFSEIESKSKTDGFFYEAGRKNHFEIKVRSFSQRKFKTFMIERQKIESLVPLHKEGYTVWYINFFTEDDGSYSVICFNLSAWLEANRNSNEDDIFYSMALPRTTAERNGITAKLVTMLTPNPRTDKIVTTLAA